MSSESIRSVAADSNVLLSAIAGRAARRVFETSSLIVVTTESNIAEVGEYIPTFARRYNLPEDALSDVLALLPIIVYTEDAYAHHIAAARYLVGQRDKDDVALAALALHLDIPIWSNDRDYDHFPTGVYATAVLLKALGM